MRMLLQYSLSSRPPTGFVRAFVVEHSGEHRGQLNLKRGGLRPVTSLGRWVAVATGDAAGNTTARLRRGVDARLLTQDEADTLIAAHDQIFGLLLEREIDAIRAGVRADTYLAPDTLDTLTRRHLRESFRAIAHVQSRLESIWTNRASG
jgi:CBS domain-containing protein